MGSSQADKAANHQRIVSAASARVRGEGVGSLNVAELMGAAGLTHGGFYRHFDSRDELVEEAIEAALEEGARRTARAAANGGEQALEQIIAGYLSQRHRDSPESGCAVAALPAEVARSTERARDAYTRQVRRYLELLTELLPARGADEHDAHLIIAALVGGLSIARAVNDEQLSQEILAGVAGALIRRIESEAR